MGIDTRISPSFHPQCIGSMDDFDSETEGELGQVVSAFTTVYQGIGKVLDARDAALANTAWTEDMQTIKIQEAADRAFAKFAPALDKVHSNMRSGCALIEAALAAPVEASAAQSVAAEIRSYVKSLSEAVGSQTDKRVRQSAVGFVQAAIQNGDTKTATSVLGAPAYLSGLSPEMHASLLRMYHEKQNPTASKRLRAMQSAMAMIQDRGALIHGELAKLVGKSPAHAAALRDRNTAAEKALGGI